jgi:hypothetical protein
VIAKLRPRLAIYRHDYAHRKIIEAITKLDQLPSDREAYEKWIEARAHLAFLEDNARSDDIVVYASGEYSCICHRASDGHPVANELAALP